MKEYVFRQGVFGGDGTRLPRPPLPAKVYFLKTPK